MGRGLVVTAVCLAVLAGCGGEEEVATSPTTGTTSEAPSTSASTSPSASETESGTAGIGGEEVALAVVAQWLARLAEGNATAAYEMLGVISQRTVDTLGGMEGLMPGLQEGMAAFADAGDRTVVGVPGQDGAHVVTYSGDIEREGITEFDARAWAVHPEGELDVIEAFSLIGPEIDSPPAGSTDLAADEDVRVYLPAGGTVTALLDGEVVTSVAEEGADGDQVLVTVSPPTGTWPAGRHVVTVAVTPTAPGGDGPWVAVAVPLTIG